MKKLLTLLTGILALVVFAATGYAQTEPPRPNEPIYQRSITVSGEAKKEVAPDQAVLSMSLVSKDKDLKVAKQHNDALVERLLNIAREYQITKDKIATSNIYIAPEYRFENNQQLFAGYNVTRSLRVTIDKLEVQERLLSAIVDAKIEQVNGIQFQIAEPEKQAGELRVKAFENAKAKAESLAQAAGAKLGKPLMISTDAPTPMFPPRPMPMMAKQLSITDASPEPPSLPGLVPLRETVHVTFALE